MTEEFEQYRSELMNRVAIRAHGAGNMTRTELTSELCDFLRNEETLQEWTPCYCDADGRRGKQLRIDAYSMDSIETDHTVTVITLLEGRYLGHANLTTDDLKKATESAAAFVIESCDEDLRTRLEASTPAADFAHTLQGRRDMVRSIRVIIISDAPTSARLRRLEPYDSRGRRVHTEVWDIVRFYQLEQKGGREPIEIDVGALVPGGLPALPAAINNPDYQAYLCVVPGRFLADIYDTHGSRLLEGNVRAFLTAKGKVNKGIRTTILRQPEHFFAFNNGITATAARVDLDSRGHIIGLCDLQIVNGGQTTASLYNTRRDEGRTLDNVFVQMKLSVLPEDQAMLMVPEIARFANTQNKVSEADLFANHPFNRNIKEISQRVWAPPAPGTAYQTQWFYEQARSQYQTERSKRTPVERSRFDKQFPKSQLITKTDLAKYENTWKGLPHIVSLGAQKNFIKYAERVCGEEGEFNLDQQSFNETWYKNMIAKAIMFKETEKVVSGAAWYQQAYRANIVPYSIAKLLDVVMRRHPNEVVDLDQIWKNQAVPEVLRQTLDSIGMTVLGILMNPDHAGANVTEWAKKESCWRRVKDSAVTLPQEIASCLASRTGEQTRQDDARRDAIEDAAITDTLRVHELSINGFWRRAAVWHRARRVLTPTEFSILEKAAYSYGWSPTDRQARVLIGAAKKLEDDGFQ